MTPAELAAELLALVAEHPELADCVVYDREHLAIKHVVFENDGYKAVWLS
jgi:hypothetical protein